MAAVVNSILNSKENKKKCLFPDPLAFFQYVLKNNKSVFFICFIGSCYNKYQFTNFYNKKIISKSKEENLADNFSIIRIKMILLDII